VIAEPCIDTKDTACVEVCPVDCIHPKKDGAEFADVNKLYIDPETCIDCGACVPVCPVQAIFPQEEVPEKWAGELHADRRRLVRQAQVAPRPRSPLSAKQVLQRQAHRDRHATDGGGAEAP